MQKSRKDNHQFDDENFQIIFWIVFTINIFRDIIILFLLLSHVFGISRIFGYWVKYLSKARPVTIFWDKCYFRHHSSSPLMIPEFWICIKRFIILILLAYYLEVSVFLNYSLWASPAILLPCWMFCMRFLKFVLLPF